MLLFSYSSILGTFLYTIYSKLFRDFLQTIEIRFYQDHAQSPKLWQMIRNSFQVFLSEEQEMALVPVTDWDTLREGFPWLEAHMPLHFLIHNSSKINKFKEREKIMQLNLIFLH